MKSEFLTPLVAEKIGKKRWKLVAPLKYYSEILGRVVIVPAGFVTDFASIPRFLLISHAFLSQTEEEAAVIHDYLYQTHQCENRKQADKVFLEAMKATKEGLGIIGRRWMYSGVRTGGYLSWRSGPKRFKILNA